MERVTCCPDANDQLLYFTSPSITADEIMVFLSDRGGHINIWARDLRSGDEWQVSDNREGFLHSYVYFDGVPRRGLGKASVCLDPTRGRVYYLQGHQLMRTDVRNPRPVGIAEIPADQVTAFTHVSSDGSQICVPTTDARALAGYPGHNIDQRGRDERLSSYLRVYDTHSGRELLAERVSHAWITHVQFRPGSNDQILYNHEWPADCGIRRMWLWDGSHHRPLRDESDGRSRRDWACHEMWTRDGREVIYHGSLAGGPAFVGRVIPETGQIVEIPLESSFLGYGHFTVGEGSTLVSDGYYHPPTDPDPPRGRGGRFISIVRPDWERRTLHWEPLCEHGSSWNSQDEHPHPVFDNACRWIYFTSDRDGRRAVWRMAVPGS
jgi:oligogalacturonide lyase